MILSNWREQPLHGRWLQFWCSLRQHLESLPTELSLRVPWEQNPGEAMGSKLGGQGWEQLVSFRVWYHCLDQNDCFPRHQAIVRNSSILCFSLTASFAPLEPSLLIILICFCFHCFSGSLFTLGWDRQIPRSPPLPIPVPTTDTADWSRPHCPWGQVTNVNSWLSVLNSSIALKLSHQKTISLSFPREP